MNLRKPLTVLVYCLPVLIVFFGVLMGGYLLSLATGDAPGAAILLRVAIACLIILVVDALLLIGLLGVKELSGPTEDEQNNRES